VAELRVEVVEVLEPPAAEERGLPTAVGPLVGPTRMVEQLSRGRRDLRNT
jgi:hypothetical protein